MKIENRIWVWDKNKVGKLELVKSSIYWLTRQRDSMMRALMTVTGLGIIAFAVWGGITEHLTLQGVLLALILFILVWR